MSNSRLRSTARGKVLLSIFVVGAILVLEVIGFIVEMLLNISDASLWSGMIPEWFGACAAVAGFALAGGAAWVGMSREDVRFTFRFGWWCMAISLALMVLDFAQYMEEGTALAVDWPVRLAQVTVMCLAIGIFEEYLFRGVIFNAMLAVMGGTHKGVVRAVLLTSLAFGLAHIDFEADFVDALSCVQAFLKVLQTGLYSFLLCVIVLRTRKLAGVSLFHAIDDLVLMVPSVAFFNEPMSTEYVVQGEEAVPTIMYYLVVIALYLPFVFKSARELQRGQDVYRGVLMEQAIAAEERYEEQLRMMETASAVPVPEMGAIAAYGASGPAVPEPEAVSYGVPAPEAVAYESPTSEMPARKVPTAAGFAREAPDYVGRVPGSPPPPKGM